MTNPTDNLPEAYETVQTAEKALAETVIANIETFHDAILAAATVLPSQASNSNIMTQIGAITSYFYSFEAIANDLKRTCGLLPPSGDEM